MPIQAVINDGDLVSTNRFHFIDIDNGESVAGLIAGLKAPDPLNKYTDKWSWAFITTERMVTYTLLRYNRTSRIDIWKQKNIFILIFWLLLV
jgi:hypothetical protein